VRAKPVSLMLGAKSADVVMMHAPVAVLAKDVTNAWSVHIKSD
jgi:hypothetical protein